MEVYLDNAATTRTFTEVDDEILSCLKNTWGNPSAKHILGFEAEKKIDEAATSIARLFSCDKKEIIFTSCATEANNTAILGAARRHKNRGRHLITSAIEHSSVKECFLQLEKEGFDVTFIPTDAAGRIDLEVLKSSLRQDTILVSIISVNNEIGTVQPLTEIGSIVKGFNEKILFHTDAVQAFGKIEINLKKAGVDMLSVSGHKFNGPKGVGFLYKKRDVYIEPLIYGGGQQEGLRSGTEAVELISGMNEAVKKTFYFKDGSPDIKAFKEDIKNLRDLKNYLISKLCEIDGVAINGDLEDSNSAPHIVSASFSGVRSEVLLHALEKEGIYVSSGSACASNRPQKSDVLYAIGLRDEALDSTIRLSLGRDTNKEQIDYTIDCLRKIVPFLRQFIRR